MLNKECMTNCVCPFTGVHMIRFPLCVLAGFAFIFIWGFILHGQFLMGLYEQTAPLWRLPEDMSMALMLLYQFLTSAISAFIFTRHYEARGIQEGMRFGLLLGSLMGVLLAAPYIWTPVPAALGIGWLIGGFIQGLGLGVIFSLIYQKPAVTV